MKIVSVPQMRELERQTFEAGIGEEELQRRAGRAVAEAVLDRAAQPGLAVAFVGTGNNGRDAWIAAQQLIEAGWQARLYLCPEHAISDRELNAFQGQSGEVVGYQQQDLTESIDRALVGATALIDGLLGIGVHGAPREPLAGVIHEVNRRRAANSSLRVFAVDVPSGLDCDSGAAEGAVVRADYTVVLGAIKQGLLTVPAAAFTGELVPVDIGIVAGPPAAAELLTEASLLGLLPPRPLDAHKGTFGRLLVVAGSEQYVGAALLVCAAAVRTGTGLVSLAAPAWLRDAVAAALPEATFLLLPEHGAAGDPEGVTERILAQLDRYDGLAIGPGLSTAGGVPEVVVQVLHEAAKLGLPSVVDADALNVLAGVDDWQEWLGERVVMTPHLGELARLVGEPLPSDAAPWLLAGAWAREWGVTLVVKGPFTAIGSAHGVWVHARPNPALATAGTGDVLTGIVGGLLARGLDPSIAARVGVAAHAAAGAKRSEGMLAGGLAASDLLAVIPEALAGLVARRP